MGDQYNSSISATPNTDYYSDEKYQKREMNIKRQEFYKTGQALYPLLFGENDFQVGLARDPFIIASSLFVISGGSLSSSYIMRGITNSTINTIVDIQLSGKVNYVSTVSSFFLNKPIFSNYFGNALISNTIIYNKEMGFSTIFNGSISLKEATIGVGVDTYTGFLGSKTGIFSNNPIHIIGSQFIYTASGSYIKKQQNNDNKNSQDDNKIY
jgi:hypothetical protein